LNEKGSLKAHNEQAWALFMEAERKHLWMRTEGHLARLHGSALPDETPEGLAWLAEEDRLRASEGLVDLMDGLGKIIHKHIDEITPQDRSTMLRAEGARLEWIVGHRYSRNR